MKKLEELINDILNERNGYKLGEIWKYSGKSAGAIVPILRETNENRDYVTLPEVKDKIKITDSGSIGKVKIENVDKPIFIRSGTMLEGKGTQSRAVEHNTIITNEGDVNVKCIHQSHPIRIKSYFDYSGIVPTKTIKHLSAGNQVQLWNSVRLYANSITSSYNTYSRTHNVQSTTDNLVEIKKAIKKFDNKIKEILEKVPAFENQVGVIIVSLNGIEGIEVFDNPKSWIAHYKDVIENYECIKDELPPLFKLDEKAVYDYIRSFLNKISSIEPKKVNENTYLISLDGYIGEFTVFNDRVIHMFVVKSDEKTYTSNIASTSYSFNIETNNISCNYDTRTEWYNEISTTCNDNYIRSYILDEIERKRGMKQIIKTLYKPKRWKDVINEIDMSKATISNRIKNGKKCGLIKEHYVNGTKYYCLTEEGKKIYNLLYKTTENK